LNEETKYLVQELINQLLLFWRSLMNKWKPWVSEHCLLTFFMGMSYHLLVAAGHHRMDRRWI
jgi:hypothetical protein